MPAVNATPMSQRTHSPFNDDTPTRAPSSGHSSLNPLTSIKPHRTLASINNALRPSYTNGIAQAYLPDPIEADNSEMHRRRVEASFQRQLDSLANANAALSISSASDHDHDTQRARRRFDDESRSSSSSSASSVLSVGSLRIGLTGTAPAGASRIARPTGGVTIQDVDDEADSDADEHLTYVTERTSVLDSPARPLAASSPSGARLSPARLGPKAAAAVTGGLFGSPRPSILSHLQSTGAVSSNLNSPRRSSPAPVSTSAAPVPARSQTNENVPPSGHSAAVRPAASSASRPSSAAFPSVAPPRTVVPPMSSPFSRSPFSSASARTAAGAAASTAYAPKHYSPLNPALNSPLNASPAPSTVRGGSGPRRRSPLDLDSDQLDEDEQSEDEENARAADRTTRTALPDRTGLTDMLRSPNIKKGVSAAAISPRMRTSPTGTGSASGHGRSAEASLVSSALAGLTSKLAALERENAESATRIAELEERLTAKAQRSYSADGLEQRDAVDRTARADEQAKKLKREVESMLGEERDRRTELERVVQSLRAQNAHLDATFSAQHAALASLRAAASAPASKSATAAGEYALRSEVQDLKHSLAALGYEVDGVRTVVEELLRDKETRDSQRRWDAEEAERRAALDELSAPGTPPEHDGDAEVRSRFVAPSEVERLLQEQDGERTRKMTQKPATKQPMRHRAARTASTDDATYIPPPSVSDSAGSQSSASLVSATSATSYTASESADQDSVDEPDFARAQRIFDDVQKAAQSHLSPVREGARRRTQPARQAKGHVQTGKGDRVVLVDEPSERLCSNCHGRKVALHAAEAAAPTSYDERGTDADAEDLAFAAQAEAAQSKAKRERRRARAAAAAAEEAAAKAHEAKKRAAEEKEKRRAKAREEHRRTLEGVLDRLEDDFAAQKKIYLELTAEYQSMASRADTRKRRVLASHLKQSIDVLEDKAREVKRYADALESLHEAMQEHSCPRPRKSHARL